MGGSMSEEQKIDADYIVVHTGGDLLKLQSEVNELLMKGYVLVGNPVSHQSHFCQALIKLEGCEYYED